MLQHGYHRHIIQQADGEKRHSPLVHLARRWYSHHLVITITNGFNNTGGDKGVGDRSIYSSDILQYFLLTNYEWHLELRLGGKFSASNAYISLIGHRQVHQGFKWLWTCFYQPKHNVFFWLLVKDRLSTGNILRRKNIQLESYNCVLFQDQIEEIAHHLITRSFTKNCWNLAHINSDDEITCSHQNLEGESQRLKSSQDHVIKEAIACSWFECNTGISFLQIASADNDKGYNRRRDKACWTLQKGKD